MSATTVVNLRRESYDVYIGRPGKGQDGYFGNPYVLRDRKDPAEREKVLFRFRVYFGMRVESDPVFRRRVLALRGKRLGCFCKPGPCHGDVIAEWVDGQSNGPCDNWSCVLVDSHDGDCLIPSGDEP